jgi:hypothetical protein
MSSSSSSCCVCCAAAFSPGCAGTASLLCCFVRCAVAVRGRHGPGSLLCCSGHCAAADPGCAGRASLLCCCREPFDACCWLGCCAEPECGPCCRPSPATAVLLLFFVVPPAGDFSRTLLGPLLLLPVLFESPCANLKRGSRQEGWARGPRGSAAVPWSADTCCL